MTENLGAVKGAAGARDDRLNEDIQQKEAHPFDFKLKIGCILAACHSPHDVTRLVGLATSVGGLCNDETRRLAWPILLGYDASRSEEADATEPWQDLPRHKDEDQVQLDVHRSFIYYPKNESDTQLDRRKVDLSAVITQVLRKHPMLSYFQGYHDIAQVFLLVLGTENAARAVAHLSLLRIRDFMLPSLSPSLAHLHLLPSILYAIQPKLCRHLSQTQPFFALAATLTLYAHDIQEYEDISRLFDFLLAQPAAVSVYFFAVIVLSRKSELFAIPADEPEMLHSVLSKLPKPLDLELLIQKTMEIFAIHPPESLPYRAWSKISCFSVLKTTRTAESSKAQTLKIGEALFEMQALQLHREQLHKKAIARMWKYRRSAGSLGLALAFGLLSYWLQRNGWDTFSRFGTKRLLRFFRVL